MGETSCEDKKSSNGLLKKIYPPHGFPLRGYFFVFMNNIILPVQIYLGLTYNCNLKCKHCYVDKKKYKQRTNSEIKNLLKKLSDWGVMKICFTHGESLLRKDAVDIIFYCQELGLYTVLLTNGILLKENLASQIKVAGVNKITISLDSLDYEYHDDLRGAKGTAQKAVKAMRVCHKLGIKYSINTTINKSSSTHLRNMVEFALKEGANDIFFLTIRPQSKEEYNRFEVLDNYFDAVAKIWKLKKEYRNKITVGFHDPLAIKFLKTSLDKEDYPILVRENVCNAGGPLGAILPNGDVQPCNFLPIKIGNVYQDDFYSIWSKENLNKKLGDFTPLECNECEENSSCMGGCKSFFLSQGKTKDFRCNF